MLLYLLIGFFIINNIINMRNIMNMIPVTIICIFVILSIDIGDFLIFSLKNYLEKDLKKIREIKLSLR